MNHYIGLQYCIIINLVIMSDTVYINGRFLTQDLSGVQRYAFEISKEISLSNSYNLILLVPKKSSIRLEYEFPFNIKKIGSNTGHLWEQIDLPRYLNTKNKSILINLTNSAPIFYKNKISTIHDLSVFENNDWFSFKYRIFYRILIPRIIKTSKKILTDSYFSKKEILNRYKKLNPDYVNIIYCANSINSNKKNIKNIKEEYLLFVGGNSKRKNLKNLISAFSKLNNQNIKLKVVGKVVKHLESDTFLKHDNIDYLGNVSNDELVDLYSNAKMLIFPSFYEGFGLPPLEAMSCGCPTIISDIPVLRELYEKAALYINPYDSENIKENILNLLGDPDMCNNLSELGLKQANKYSWKKSADKIINLIKGLS